MIQKIAIVGSGMMGAGISQVAATSGHEVFLIDKVSDALASALLNIESSLSKLHEKGRIQETPKDILNRIKTTTEISRGVSGVDFAIEAIFEDINLKRQIFAEMDRHAPPGAILASNTSSLPITVIGEATRRREKTIGMHWMNPAQLMKLVEVTRSKYTSDDTLNTTLDLCRKYGKDPITVLKDVWFFLAVRARFGFSLEAALMYIRKDADFKDIDATIRYKLGLPMGEYELMDFTGAVEIRSRSLESAEAIFKQYPEFEPWTTFLELFRYVTRELYRPMYQKGLTGVKSGKGFYSYPGGKYAKPEIPKELADKVDPIQLMAPAINVAAICVTSGIGSKDDVNKSFRLAFGWPRGIFEYVNDYGKDNLVKVLEAKEQKAPSWLKEFYKPDPLLVSWSS